MAVVLTSTVPLFNTPDEHRQLVSATPQNFSDIPPVLRHKQEDVQVVFDPPVPNHSSWGLGTLYVIDSLLVFIQHKSGTGFEIQYPAITLHAISRPGVEAPYVYCQLDDSYGITEGAADVDEDIRELKLTPSDSASISAIFEALSLCASFHPDTAITIDEDEDDDAFVDTGNFDVFNGSEEEEMSAVGRAALEYLESITDYGPFGKPQTNGA